MKLYRLETAGRLAWVSTKAEVAARKKEWNEGLQSSHAIIEVEEIDVPTSKKELLAWLNEHQV